MAYEASQRGIRTEGTLAIILGLEVLVMLLVGLRLVNKGRLGGNVYLSPTKGYVSREFIGVQMGGERRRLIDSITYQDL
jgi:hypothetical protein